MDDVSSDSASVGVEENESCIEDECLDLPCMSSLNVSVILLKSCEIRCQLLLVVKVLFCFTIPSTCYILFTFLHTDASVCYTA